MNYWRLLFLCSFFVYLLMIIYVILYHILNLNTIKKDTNNVIYTYF